jgi:hypothetical protein
MNQPQLGEFKHKDVINDVFTPENLTGIVELINYLSPRETSRIKDTEYETIVAAAKADAVNNMVQAIMTFSLNNNKID